MKRLLQLISRLSLFIASGELSGASRFSTYQSDESEKLKQIKKF